MVRALFPSLNLLAGYADYARQGSLRHVVILAQLLKLYAKPLVIRYPDMRAGCLVVHVHVISYFPTLQSDQYPRLPAAHDALRLPGASYKPLFHPRLAHLCAWLAC